MKGKKGVDNGCPLWTIEDMSSFTKLFNSIVTSTIWDEPDHVRLLWVTMMAMATKGGVVEASIPGLARLARISVDQCEDGLQRLSSPDKYSRTEEREGRRIEKVDGGWRLINYEKYRNMLSQEERRQYKTLKQRQYRANRGHSTVQRSPHESTESTNGQNGHTAEAEAEKSTPHNPPKGGKARKRAVRPSLSDVKQYGEELGLPTEECEAFFDHFESNGWKVGGKTPMKDWRSALRNWKRRRKNETSKRTIGKRNEGREHEIEWFRDE